MLVDATGPANVPVSSRVSPGNPAGSGYYVTGRDLNKGNGLRLNAAMPPGAANPA
jgi:hypothetical protein